MKRALLALALLLLIPTAAYARDPADILDEFCAGDDQPAASNHKEWSLRPHKRTYLLYQTGTHSVSDGYIDYIKLQFSFRQHICKAVHFGYTQKAFWSIHAPSRPFRETNYNPELFLDLTRDGSGMLRWGKIGLEHESNGRDGFDSRSWDRPYWEPMLVLDDPSRLPYDFKSLTVSFKAWGAFRKDENSDILDYYGPGELTVLMNQFWYQVAFIGRKGLRGNYGSVQLDVNYHFLENIDLFFQVWDGYGESLIGYNQSSTRWGVGLAMSR